MYKDFILHYNYYNISEIKYKKKHLKLNDFKTTYIKNFKLKLKVIKLASVTLIKWLTHNIHILKIEQMACDFVKY